MNQMLEFPSEDRAYEEFVERYSDGLPIVLPTPERVARMLAGSREDPDDVLGHVMPAGSALTIRDVAINAVTAGGGPLQPQRLTVDDALRDAARDLQRAARLGSWALRRQQRARQRTARKPLRWAR